MNLYLDNKFVKTSMVEISWEDGEYRPNDIIPIDKCQDFNDDNFNKDDL